MRPPKQSSQMYLLVPWYKNGEYEFMNLIIDSVIHRKTIDPNFKLQGRETNYQEISGLLTNDLRQDFTFIHPEYFLDSKYEIANGSVLLNNHENKQKYDALILTGCKIISLKTLEKKKKFEYL